MGFLGPLGSILKMAGTGANMLGQPYAGIPLQMAGGAAEGADEGGFSGAAKGAGKSGLGSILALGTNAGIGKTLDALKSPVDTGAFTAFSSGGSPLTVPGARPDAIEGLQSSMGGGMTIPASPKALFGGS